MNRNCKSCKFYASRSDQKVGACRRYPPRKFTDSDFGQWPKVHDEDWCGHFVPINFRDYFATENE